MLEIFMFFPHAGMLKLSEEKKASGIKCDLVSVVVLTVLKLQLLIAVWYNA